MQIDQHAGHAPHVRRVADGLSSLKGPCIGCSDCLGLCAALVEVMTLPTAVLEKGASK